MCFIIFAYIGLHVLLWSTHTVSWSMSSLVEFKDVLGEGVLSVGDLVAELTAVLEGVGEMNSFHMVQNIVLLSIHLSTQCADELGH